MVGAGLVGGAMAAAAGDWVAVALRSRRAEYLLKPLAMALLLAAALVLGREAPAARLWLTATAVGLSLAGDVLLMLPSDRFLPGLASFLLAHVAYVGAFNPTPPPVGATVVAAAVAVAVAVPLYLRLLRGMASSGRPVMAVPVALYVVAIGAMVVSASVTLARPEWAPGRAALATAGALLFMSSDALLGWTRFVRPLRWGPEALMATYHLGQVALVLALVG